jgi:hypothetical protein
MPALQQVVPVLFNESHGTSQRGERLDQIRHYGFEEALNVGLTPDLCTPEVAGIAGAAAARLGRF